MHLQLLNNSALLRNVDTVQELTDILVAGLAALLDRSGSLGDVLQIVTSDDELTLLLLADLDLDTLESLDVDSLLAAQVVLDLERAVLLDIQVGREESVDAAHLVLVTLGDTDDHVVDDGLDGADGSDLLTVAVNNGNLDLAVADLLEGDINVGEVVVQSTTGAVDSDLTGLDLDSDVLGDAQDLLLLDETHLVWKRRGRSEKFRYGDDSVSGFACPRLVIDWAKNCAESLP